MNTDVKKGISDIYKSSVAKVFIMALLLYIISGVLQPTYFQPQHIMVILVVACFLGIICIGQNFVIISGGADLSVAYTITFAACVYAQVVKDTGSGIAGFVCSIAVGIVIGLFKGIGVAYLEIPSMVMTLATNSILMSASFIYTKGVLKGNASEFLHVIAKESFYGIRYIVIIWLVLGSIGIYILKRTTFGRKVFAIGSNMRVSELSGIHTKGTLIGIYVYSTLMMVIAGILLVGYLGYPNYTMADDYQLISIAAVVIGGTSILGGSGDYVGTIGGVIIIYLIQSVLTILSIPEAGKEIVNGAIILVILFAYGRSKRLNR